MGPNRSIVLTWDQDYKRLDIEVGINDTEARQYWGNVNHNVKGNVSKVYIPHFTYAVCCYDWLGDNDHMGPDFDIVTSTVYGEEWRQNDT